MMRSNIKTKNSIHNLCYHAVETRRAYFTLTVYLIFYFSLMVFQGLLPFNQTLVGLVTLTQMFICLFLTISVTKLSDSSSIFLYLFSMIIMILSEFNRIVCEAANLDIMIEVSTLIFFTLNYYRISYQHKLHAMTLLN